jgi:hypothetical protein
VGGWGSEQANCPGDGVRLRCWQMLGEGERSTQELVSRGLDQAGNYGGVHGSSRTPGIEFHEPERKALIRKVSNKASRPALKRQSQMGFHAEDLESARKCRVEFHRFGSTKTFLSLPNAVPGVWPLSGWRGRADQHKEEFWNHQRSNPACSSGSSPSRKQNINHRHRPTVGHQPSLRNGGVIARPPLTGGHAETSHRTTP